MNSLYRIDVNFAPFVSEFKTACKRFPTFKRDMADTLAALEQNPEIGDQVRHTNDYIFKIRIGVKGQIGKRGGYRLLYHVNCTNLVVTPLVLYFKPDTPTLSHSEIAARLGKFAEYIKQDPTLLSGNPPPPAPN